MRRNARSGLSGPFDRGWRSGFSAPFALGAAGAPAVSDAYAIGGASPELVAAFTLAADGTTAGEYYRKAGSETTFGDLFTHSASGLTTMFDSTGTLVWAPHNITPYSESPANWNTTGTWTGGQTGLNGNTAVLADNGRAIISVADDAIAGAKYTCQWAAKAGTATTVGLEVYGRSGAYETAQFTLSGAGSIPAEDVDFDDVRITLLADGWYLLEIDYTATAAHTIQNILARCDGSTSDSGTAYFDSPRLFRSDLGGMADNPDQSVTGFTKYVSTGTGSTSVYGPRRNAYYYNAAWVKGGLRLESAAATNLFTYSQDFTQADWTKGRGAFSDDGTTGLGGQAGSFLWTCDTTGAGAALSQTGKGAATTKQCLWTVAEAGNWNLLLVNYYNATDGHQSAWFDLTAGTKLTTSGGVLNDSGIHPLGAGRYLCYITVTPTVTDASDLWRIFMPDADGSYNCDSGDNLYVYHMQTEVGSMPSSPIITTGSTVARAAEALSIAGADSPISATEATLAADVLLTSDGNGPEIFNITAAGNWVRIYPRSTASTYAQWRPSYTPEVTAAQGGTISAGINQPVTVALGIKASDEVQLVAQGNAGTAVSTTTITNFSGQDISISGNIGEGSFFYKTIRIWSTKLPAADLVTAGTAS